MTSPPDPVPPATRSGVFVSGALAVLVLAFAFLGTSTPLRDATVWTHLAVGRALAAGEYRFGVDPLSYTTAGVYWVNHAWLFDFGLYLVYQHLGATALACLKPLAVAALAAVWLLCRRAGSGPVGPAVAAVVGVLALAPRVALGPLLASTVLLAATVGLLAHHVGPNRPARNRVWALVPLFALWANLDGWFVLGPLTLALFWLGERLRGGERRLSAGLLAAGAAACLLGPHHVFALALPPEVSPAVLNSELRDDPRFARFFQRGYSALLDGGDWYARLPGVAVLALAAAGLVSFRRCREARTDGRLFVWLATAALAAWSARLIPLFVAVAVPVLVLSLQDVRARAADGAPRPRWQRFGARALVGVAGAGLLAFAWLGGPLGARPDRRRVAWEVQPDAGLRLGAETRAEWRRTGRLAESDRVFHLHPDSASYAHWFAPGERCFLDHRLALFARVAPEYRAIGRGLTPDAGPVALPSAHGITCVVAHDPDVDRLKAALSRLWHPASGCVLLDLGGREATFGLRDRARGGEPFDRWRMDLDALAFAPAAPTPPPAGGGVGAATTWEPLWRTSPPRRVESDTAALLLQYAEDQVTNLAPEVARAQAATAVAGLIAATPGERTPSALGLRLDQTTLYLPPLDSAPPSAALLAIRAARAAVAAAPDDPLAHLRLAQAYLALTYTTREAVWADRCRPLAQLRHVQAAGALGRAVALAPDLEAAHALSARVYAQRGMTDAVLHHLREQARILARGGPDAGNRLRGLRDQLDGLEAAVQDRRSRFALRSQGLGNAPLQRANIALQLGLPRTALDDVLLPSTVVLFGVEGARLELELLLMLGRPDRARHELDDDEFRLNQDRLGAVELPGTGAPNHPPVYRLPAYAWHRFLLAAADGDYRQAEESVRAMTDRLRDERAARERNARSFVARAVAAEVGLGLRPRAARLDTPLAGDVSDVIRISDHMNRTSRQVEADLRCLAGALALECGRADEAAEHFRGALALAGAAGAGFPAEPVCRAYLGRLQDAARR